MTILRNLYAKDPPISTTPTASYYNSDRTRASDLFSGNDGSTGKGILIGLMAAFGSAALVAIVFLVIYFFLNTAPGRIILDRMGRPGGYDDEQALAIEEAEALEEMDEMQRAEYLRAKAFVQANPPDSMQTDISLSQYLAIQEKGVSAWEFEPELEIANCFVEARTEIEFFDSECSVQSNLPVPKQNDIYYWEAKIYDKPESTMISVGMATKPYPLFRMPGWHKYSAAYTSSGHRRYNQPFSPTPYGPLFVQGDVIGVGYRPRSGTVFFTRNGKKLPDVADGLKTQNFFPTIGANGPCTVHVNFGQMGFVFIEANVKKWGLAPMTGSLAPPPPYGSEQGSILLEAGREGASQQEHGQGAYMNSGHSRTRSGVRFGIPQSPGPVRSPTDISLAPLTHIPSHEDAGEGPSGVNDTAASHYAIAPPVLTSTNHSHLGYGYYHNNISEQLASPSSAPPPDYSSPAGSIREGGRRNSSIRNQRLQHIPSHSTSTPPPIPSYEFAVASANLGRQPEPRNPDERR
ncbi:MAG: Rsp5p-dependent ubiquitination, sorting of cargo proteins at the multivesicular body [Trizodia sp. TS-e1964]|nr:MAG: Rsp5p-dependent ubiquitination, sorting of cargo proteins at the multivesicular body [Trizodia sp. TS-e1964]